MEKLSEIIEIPNIILNKTVPAYTAKNLPILKRNISDAYYNGSLKSEIAEGDFRNVRVGDYIVGKTTGTIYYVVDLDYWYHKGDTSLTSHHLTLMPFKLQGSMNPLWRGYGHSNKSWRVSADDKGRCPWNAASNVNPQNTESVGSDTTSGSYVNAYIKTYALARYYNEWLKADFAEADILKFRNLLANAIDTSNRSAAVSSWTGMSSEWAWYDSYCDLPSEPNLYGSMIFSSSAFDVGVQKEQLALFKQADIFDFYDRMDMWTKAVASSTPAAFLRGNGLATNLGASGASWVCPLSMIK